MKLFYLILISICAGCGAASSSFVIHDDQAKIDYSNLDHWAAHPNKIDPADNVPGQKELAIQKNCDVNVFFIHPTTYVKKAVDKKWNAPINDKKINAQTDKTTIKFQASIFNQAGAVYAPRYRQAHLQAYYIDNKKGTTKAFERAYQDVRGAFLHFINSENNNKPFIIASHSQGTTHAKKLLKEEIDKKPIRGKLILAYLIGIEIEKDHFKNIPPCLNSLETGCIVSWRTYKTGFFPDDTPLGDHILVTNPPSWTLDKDVINKSKNKGAILKNFNKIVANATNAKIENGILWADKPKFPFSFLFTRKNYHIADYNLYYFNIQENAKDRVHSYFRTYSLREF